MFAEAHTLNQPTEPPVRGAVIGCGWMGAGTALNPDTVGIQSHAGAMAAHPGAELIAVCDADHERANSAARDFGPCKVFTNPQKLLEAEMPELVTISTPDETHANLVRLALSAPSTRAILVEKPLAMTTDEARAVAREAEARGVLLAVNYSRRYCPAFQSLRDEIRNGEFGDIQQVSGYYGKGIVHNGTHWIDLLRFLVDDVKIAEVLPGPFPDAATPSVRFLTQSETPAFLLATNSAKFTLFEMDLIGTCGRVQIQNGGHEIIRSRTIESPLYRGHRNLDAGQSVTCCLKNAMVHAIDDILACLLTPGRKSACPAAEAVACLEIAERVALQIRKVSAPFDT